MERMSHVMPAGPADELTHRGARRSSTRYLLEGEVEVTGPFDARGFLFNASAGGLRMAIDHPAPVGARLAMRLRFAGGRESEEVGDVVWSRELPDGWLVGVRFVDA